MNATLPIARDEARITPAIEDYLKAIYQLNQEEPDAGSVTGQRIAERLGVASPSVTNMMKRLSDLGLVQHERYRGVELSDAGERIALEVVRHHRLLERYLVEALGYGWDEVHDEAERLEHHISEALEARMAAVLGDPTVDPHGDPIPHLDGSIADITTRSLLELVAGDIAVVHRVSDRDPERLRYLEELGIRPGVTIRALEVLPFEGPLRLAVAGTEHVIGRPLAAAVQVAPRESGGE
jgi:DtxR family transcriptional regulator, Mn-dependent transcriptional regulator